MMEPPEKSPKTVADTPSPSKRTAQYAKTTRKEGPRVSPAISRRQNGDGVSSNGKKENFGGGLGFGDLRIDSLDDSEMNGVSSLLKMQESEGLKGLGSVLDFIDRDENRGIVAGDGGDMLTRGGAKGTSGFGRGVNEGNPDGNSWELNENDHVEGWEDAGDEWHGFSVGDFVWGKIRSHPWWPGRIYDPLVASDYAKKVKQTDKILVAYFGDRTFAWCSPSQLIPFQYNFLDMSMQSSSKSFVNAVEEAVNEVGRLVDLKMTCSCVPKDNLFGFGRTLVVNAGIKEGILVPEAGIHKFSAALSEPTEFLPALRHIAQVAIAPNVLEFSILKYWLSAFYRAKGGYELPKYQEPQPIPGLEDDTRNWSAESNTYSSGVEVAVQGPVEDWLSSPLSPKFGQNSQSLQKCQGISDDRHYHRRKQKSIAQILAGQTDAEAERKKDDVTSDETATSTQRKKRPGINKLVGTNVHAQGKVELGDATKDLSNSGTPASPPGMKKRKERDDSDGGGQTKMQDGADAGTVLGKPASLSGRKKSKTGDETVGEPKNAARDVVEPRADPKNAAVSSEGAKSGISGEANILGGNASISRPKTMKQTQTQVVDSLVVSDNAVTSLEIDDGGKRASGVNPMLKDRKKRESASDEYDIGSKNESKDSMAAAEKSRDGGLSSPTSLSEGTLSRERKKSKYLCPPFTNVERGHKKKEVEEEFERVLKQISDNLDPRTPKQDRSSVIGPSQLNLSANEILSQIRSAALDPTYLGEQNSFDMAEGFLSAFRSSIYSSESNDKSYKKHQPGRKRKSQESESESSMKEPNQANLISDDQKSGTTWNQKNEAAKSDKPNENQTASAPFLKEKEQESGGKAPAAALILTFGPGASIPSKDDAIKIYGKFGALDEEETEILYNHRSAKIVFLRSHEAEEAFNVSQLASPFGAASVTFQLRYLSADTKTRKLKEISSSQNTSPAQEGGITTNKTLASHVSSSNVSQLNYIKQKLELMTSMLSDGKMSPVTKSKLQTEMKSLLEEVSTMAAASSSQKG